MSKKNPLKNKEYLSSPKYMLFKRYKKAIRVPKPKARSWNFQKAA